MPRKPVSKEKDKDKHKEKDKEKDGMLEFVEWGEDLEWGEFLHMPNEKFYDFKEIKEEIQRFCVSFKAMK